MKPYGVPRNICAEFPDPLDAHEFGLKASKCKLRGKGGDFHPNAHNTEDHRRARRIWKRAARRTGAADTAARLSEIND